jgi:hypothetical protein
MRVSWFPCFLAFALAGLLVASVTADDPPVKRQPVKGKKGTTKVEGQLSDEEALKKAGLTATDGGKLIEYLQQRTLSDSEQSRIEEIIRRFGADDFDERVRATEEIEVYGPAAVGPLKAAAKHSDPEIAYRARVALKKVETVPHSSVAAAAVRAVVSLKPQGAAAALVGFLPLADDESVAELIRDALVTLAVTKDGTADPGLVAALDDGSPVRRAAAYVALTQGGPAGERIRIKDAYPKVRAAVLKDTDPEAKFAGLWSLVLTTREKEYVPALVALIPKLNRGRIWQLEDLLLQFAGTHPKDGRFLKSPESLGKARDAWLAWWKEKGDEVDLLKLEYKPRITGVTDIIEMDQRGLAQGRVISLGPDLKEKWRISGVHYPTDMHVAANGHVFVVESNNSQITERNTTGAILNRHNISQQPVNLQKLPDGRAVVVCRNGVYEFDKDWKQTWFYRRDNYDAIAGIRLPNGETFVITNQGQPQASGIRLDAKGKVTGKAIALGQVFNPHVLDVVGEDKVLLCESNRVAEYDLKTGKQTWKYDCNNPGSCQRLPNGNTLIALINEGKVIEIDPSGEIVWEFQGRDGLRAGRAYRR